MEFSDFRVELVEGVDVQIERPAEALDDRHGAPARLLDADGARVVPPSKRNTAPRKTVVTRRHRS
jgi:hypothetical protein